MILTQLTELVRICDLYCLPLKAFIPKYFQTFVNAFKIIIMISFFLEILDYGRQSSNNNSTNSNPEQYNESVGTDEVGYERVSDNLRQVPSLLQGNDQRMPALR